MPMRVSSKKVAKFIVDAQNEAARQYDLFVAKLVLKIGKAESATLEGNHVWDHSTLTVVKAGNTERWNTKQIWNVSKLGKDFPQWPTRKLK